MGRFLLHKTLVMGKNLYFCNNQQPNHENLDRIHRYIDFFVLHLIIDALSLMNLPFLPNLHVMC